MAPLQDLTGLLASIAGLSIVPTVLAVIIAPLVNGMYPSMVRSASSGERIDLSDALGKSVRKYRRLIVSHVLIILIIGLATIALIVPGLILATWYYYTTPAIVLEDRGVSDAMDTSKAFARDKKWDTFALLAVGSGPTILSGLVQRIGEMMWIGSGFMYFMIISFFAGFLSAVLSAIMASYVYVNYAKPKQISTEPMTKNQ